MKVLIQTDCAVRGEYLEAGQSYELDSHIAIELIQLGRAIEAPIETAKPKATRKVKDNAAD